MEDRPLIGCPACHGTGAIRSPFMGWNSVVPSIDENPTPTLSEVEIIIIECPRCYGHRVIEAPKADWSNWKMS